MLGGGNRNTGDVSSGRVTVLLGTGDGSLRQLSTYGSGSTIVSASATADVNSDGWADVVLFDRQEDSVHVLLGQGNGALQTPRAFAAGAGHSREATTARASVAIMDVDGDYRPDLLISSCPDNVCAAQVSVLIGNGDGSFQSPVGHGTSGPGIGILAVVDLNADGYVDTVTASCVSSSCRGGWLDVLLHEASPSDAGAVAPATGATTPAAESPGASSASANEASTPAVSTPGAATYNVTVATDSAPDLTSLQSLIDSTTSRWPSNREKVWALFYWGHILKRQSGPMVLHGFEVTDPIRNFMDYGFTQCSTISGINQSLFEGIGLRHQFWDICNHTVSAVEYDGTFHMIDTSMSHLVTTDDGATLASVTEAAADSARLVRERSLYATSPNGFLTGSDTLRNLPDFTGPTGGVTAGFARAFCADSLKYRDYYYNWNAGHRYVLNLREDESYTRYYRRLGTTPTIGSAASTSARRIPQ